MKLGQVTRLTRRLDRSRQTQREEPETESVEADDGGDTTVGDFTFSDVQLREDGVGDFEIRTRVTNNGPAEEFVDIQATLFKGGKVVADLTALEEFAAGQTRTVTLTGTDDYGEWDDIEFTVDAGF